MRVLVTTTPSWGHLAPMLGVLRALQAAGHQVTVATFHATLASLGLPAVPAGLSEAELLAERLRRWPRTATQPPGVWAVRMFTEIAAPAMAADLHRMITDWTPDLVLSEEGEHGGARFAADRAHPFLSHGWGSPLSAAPNGDLATAHIDPCPPSLNTPGWTGPPRWPVRLTTPRLVPADPDTMAWIARRNRPLAYVGFGTVAQYASCPKRSAGCWTACWPAASTRCAPTRRTGGRSMTGFGSSGSSRYRTSCPPAHSSSATAARAPRSRPWPTPFRSSCFRRGAPSQHRMARACVARGVGVVLDDNADPTPVTYAVLTGDYPRHAAELAREIAVTPDPAHIVTTIRDIRFS